MQRRDETKTCRVGEDMKLRIRNAGAAQPVGSLTRAVGARYGYTGKVTVASGKVKQRSELGSELDVNLHLDKFSEMCGTPASEALSDVKEVSW